MITLNPDIFYPQGPYDIYFNRPVLPHELQSGFRRISQRHTRRLIRQNPALLRSKKYASYRKKR